MFLEGALPPLDRAAELDAVKRGDRELLIRSNLALVCKIAQRYARFAAGHFEDLCSEGTLGLIQAVDKFDVSRDIRLNTYATWWIRLRIVGYIRDKQPMIRVPEKVAKRLRDLHRRLQRRVSPMDIDGLPLRADAKNSMKCALFARKPSTDVHTEEVLDGSQLPTVDIEAGLATLSKRERSIVVGYYLNSLNDRALAKRHRLTHQRVTQIRHSALTKLRTFYESAEGD